MTETKEYRMLRIGPETHRKLRILAAQTGETMIALIDRLVTQQETNMNMTTQIPTVTVEAWLTKYGELTIRHNGKITTLSKQHDITAMLADLKVTDTQTDKVQEGFAVRAEMPTEHIERLTWWTA